MKFIFFLHTFLVLHETLQERLEEEFNVQKRTRGGAPNGEIPTKLRLSAAIRYFAGASIYDIILTHGMSKQSVYNSVHGVVNVVNEDPSFALPNFHLTMSSIILQLASN